jgi:hypothetical protein
MVNVEYGTCLEEILIKETDDQTDEIDEIEPDIDSDDWFTKLNKDEIITDKDGQPLPKLAGLRRLAKPFIRNEYSKVNKVCLVTKEIRRSLNEWGLNNQDKLVVVGRKETIGVDYYPYASVTFTIVDTNDRTWSDSADAYYGNCNDLGNYPTAVASARAEGRVLRKLLGIKEHVFEEISSKNAIDELTSEEDRPIAPEQKKVIETSIKKTDVYSLKDLFGKVTARDVSNLDDLTAAEAVQVIKILNEAKKKGLKK